MKKSILLSSLLVSFSLNAQNTHFHQPNFGSFFGPNIGQNIGQNVWRDIDHTIATIKASERQYLTKYFNQKDNVYVVKMRAKNFKKAELSITIQGLQMTITGKTQSARTHLAKAQSEQATKSDRQQTFSRSFKNTFTLPKDADTQHISATFKQGILQINLPKLAKPASRTITIY